MWELYECSHFFFIFYMYDLKRFEHSKSFYYRDFFFQKHYAFEKSEVWQKSKKKPRIISFCLDRGGATYLRPNEFRLKLETASLETLWYENYTLFHVIYKTSSTIFSSICPWKQDWNLFSVTWIAMKIKYYNRKKKKLEIFFWIFLDIFSIFTTQKIHLFLPGKTKP